MMKSVLKTVVCQTALLGLTLGSALSAQALSIDWSGTYRFEYTEVDKTSLDDPSLRKAYFLNHLSLSPKIIAADGVNIVGKFEILPNDQYPDSQAGQPFGRGPTKAGTTSSTKDDSAVAGDKQGSSTLKVQQLYLTVNQEYGMLVAGRAPLDFGLGISHSAGNGAFDHWYSTRDMVGYKFLIGNFSFMPIMGKVYDQSVSQGEEAQDVIWHVDYTNPETESSIGVMHQSRTASPEANDAPASQYSSTGVVAGRWNTQLISIYLARGFEDVKFKVEAGFESGSTGVQVGNTNTEEISLNGYGIAVELDFPNPQSRWHWNLKTGIASGDNPTTTNYEGFHFHRNYDVAFLLFNHPLGRYDIMRSYAQRGPDRTNCVTAPCAPYSTDTALDDESISNALYVSPKAVYNINDKWDWTNRITWAQLQTNPLANSNDALNVDVAKDLGFEWDTGVVFRPHERIQWVNELGLLFPGAAWKAGSRDYGNSFTYGFSSKAAISF
ncbi:MAG: hypothetical protein ACAH59_08990 [Pseudobdellovibrionaceae bacterium]